MGQSVPDPIRNREMLRLYGRAEHRLNRLFVVGIICVIVHKALSMAILQPEPATWQADPFDRSMGNQLLGVIDTI
jgi:hypothetical protein